MQLATSYLQGQPGIFDGVLEAYGQGQTLRQNRDLLQAQQAEQARKIQAQQQLEALDWDDMGAVSRVVAQFPEYTKGAQDYYKNMEAKEQQAMLGDMSKAISALGSQRPDVAVQTIRDKANLYRDMGNEEKAEEYSQMAEWMANDPQSARKSLIMNYSLLAGKDAASAYNSYSDVDIAEAKLPNEIADIQATTGETQAKTINERVKAAGGVNEIISTAALTDDPNSFMEMIDTAYDMGLMTPEKYNSILKSVSGDGVEAVAALRQYARGNPGIIDKLLPQATYTNLGDAVAVTDYNPQTGQFNNKGTMTKGVDPNQKYSSDTNYNIAGVNQAGADRRAVLASETSQANNSANNATAQARLQFDQQQAQIKAGESELKEAGGKYYMVRKSDGAIFPAMGADGQQLIATNKGKKPRTESQTKDYLFGSRMQEANNIVARLESSGTDRGSLLSRAGGAGEAVANVIPSFLGGNSPEQQQYIQAQRDFINAILRRESGAAIAESEFANARKQYFAQVGDSDAVKAQKKRNRELATSKLLESANGEQTPTVSGGRGNSAVDLSGLFK